MTEQEKALTFMLTEEFREVKRCSKCGREQPKTLNYSAQKCRCGGPFTTRYVLESGSHD